MDMETGLVKDLMSVLVVIRIRLYPKTGRKKILDKLRESSLSLVVNEKGAIRNCTFIITENSEKQGISQEGVSGESRRCSLGFFCFPDTLNT